MKTKGTKILWVASLSIILLSSCSNSSEDSRWSYSKDDMSNFISIDGKLTKSNDGTATFVVSTDEKLFDSDLTVNDVIVYDVDSAVKGLGESKKGYADYSVLKAASVLIKNIQTAYDKSGFEVTFNTSDAESYGMLINSSVTSSLQYLMVNESKNDLDDPKDPQAEFEDYYINKGVSWEDGGKFVYQLITGIGTIIVGVATENPGTMASGIFSLLGTLSESLLSGGPTMQDIMDQLKETDRKIDELSAKIDRNTQQLADEIVRAEAMVDQANLNTLNIAINDFATNCMAPINTFNRNLADEVGFYYRDYVKSTETINLRLSKNEKGEWESDPLGDMKGATNYSLTISNFDNASAHLAKHGNIVEEGFMDELGKDIENAIDTNNLPEGLEKETLRDFVAAMIYEEFCKQYFYTNKDKAQQYRNYMIECSQRISGAAGMISILNTYSSRLQCMFNFAGEIKDSVRTLSANIMKFLDMNTARASEAALFAELSSAELESNFKTARETIQKFYKNVSELPDTYSFTSSATLSGGWYRARYDLNYLNPGNKCVLDVKFNLTRMEMYGISNITYYDDDISNHYGLSSIQHARIATRWGLLRSSGVIESDSDYINYLNDSKVISDASMQAAKTCFNWNHALVDQCYRIITSDRAERELNISDTSMWIYCVGQGNPDGDYFTVGNGYGYREKHVATCWYGRTFESTFVNAATGSYGGNQRVCMWARYAESHWYWADDEYWAFKNLENTNYFFSIDAI